MSIKLMCRIVFALFAVFIGVIGAYVDSHIGNMVYGPGFWCSIGIDACWGYIYGRYESRLLKKF